MSASLTLLAPLAAGSDAGAVRRDLLALGRGDASPFARTEGTHLARLVLVDRLEPAELLLGAVFDGEARAWLRALHRGLGDDATRVFGACAGRPLDGGATAFADWALEREVPANAVLLASPGATVGDVRDALALRERVRSFARSAHAAPAGELHARYRAEVLGMRELERVR